LVKHLIEAGGATKESIMEVVWGKPNTNGLASQFAYLRLTGYYPIVGEDGILDATDEAGWEKLQEVKKANRKAVNKKSPYDRLEAAKKRVERCVKKHEKVTEKLEKDYSRDTELREIIADAEVELANMELTTAQELYDAAPEDGRGDPAPIELGDVEETEPADDEELL
jgi:hypothetical protein